MRLISNTNKPNDRMYFLLSKYGKNTTVLIASAFFADSDLLIKMLENNCTVYMIIRLDVGTSPEALLKVIDKPNIYIRYFSERYFHPKLFIFGREIAYLGSANFTHSGLTVNNELDVEITSDEPIFDDLDSTFSDYWEQAEVLTKERIIAFQEAIKGCYIPEPHQAISKAVGTVMYNNAGFDGSDLSKEDRFISDFRKNYQIYIGKFNQLKSIFEEIGTRRYPDLPIRIEVDRFLWWLGVEHVKGKSYKDVPEQPIQEIKQKIVGLIEEYKRSTNEYLDRTANEHFCSLNRGFETAEKINKYNYDELFEILCYVYAFHDRLRFYPNGLSSMKKSFIEKNSLDQIKKTIIYLLFGKDEYEMRVFKCIKTKEYKLADFGEHCIKELFGRVNKNDVPICNGRTLKSMQWLGFGKLE